MHLRLASLVDLRPIGRNKVAKLWHQQFKLLYCGTVIFISGGVYEFRMDFFARAPTLAGHPFICSK